MSPLARTITDLERATRTLKRLKATLELLAPRPGPKGGPRKPKARKAKANGKGLQL